MIEITYENWIRYADVIGDKNPIHRDEGFARSHGLAGRIAPGMFVASHIDDDMMLNFNVLFSGKVFSGDSLESFRENHNYRFIKQGDSVCDIIRISPLNSLDSRGVYSHTYTIDEMKAKVFQESLGREADGIPIMMLASLSAPALLNYGLERGIQSGIHLSQSFSLHYRPVYGEVKVEVVNDAGRKRLRDIDLIWRQEGREIASGTGRVFIRG